MLECLGCKVRSATTQEAGARLARAEHFDLFVCNFAFPEASRLQLRRKSLHVPARTPIVCYTRRGGHAAKSIGGWWRRPGPSAISDARQVLRIDACATALPWPSRRAPR